MTYRRSTKNQLSHPPIEHPCQGSSRLLLPRRSWRERLTSLLAAVIASAAIILSQFALAFLYSRQPDLGPAEKPPVGADARTVIDAPAAPQATSGPFIEESSP